MSIDEGKPLFLIDKYKLSYAPSLTVLNFAFKSYNHNNKTKFLGIGNSLEVDITDITINPDNSLPGLRFVRDEVREVGSLFKDNEKIILMDDKAVRSAIIKDSDGFDIILFSAHAMLIEKKPQQSCIFLHEDNESNGRLTILDIERLNLKSNLVILSACETGRVSGYEGNTDQNEYNAKYPLGDDLVGLQRAFIKAGSSSVLSTLWFVDDEATKSLIVDFVKGYKAEKDKVTALRDAILKLRRTKEKESNNDWAHPYFWAPFILSGDWR